MKWGIHYIENRNGETVVTDPGNRTLWQPLDPLRIALMVASSACPAGSSPKHRNGKCQDNLQYGFELQHYGSRRFAQKTRYHPPSIAIINTEVEAQREIYRKAETKGFIL